MTEYKNERNHKKLLVPIIALILCATAMVGLVYAAQTSSVTNQANVVSSDGIDARLLNSKALDNFMENEQFSNVDYGFNPYTVQDGADHQFRVPVADTTDKVIGVIGSGILYLNSFDGEDVNITFEVKFSTTDDSSPFGTNVSVVLVLTSGTVSQVVGTGVNVGAAGAYYNVELMLVATDTVDDEGGNYAVLEGVSNLEVFEDLTYGITIFANKV